MSLDKKILFEHIAKHCENPEILWLTKKIIFHDPTTNFYRKGNPALAKLIPSNKSLFEVPKNQGLPIGNLTSQFFANIYLNALDQFIKHELKARHYLRYVDDFLLIHENPKQLTIWKKRIDIFLEKNLKLRLHPKKSIQQSIYKGINFVGFIVKPNYCLVRRRIVNNFKEKLNEFNSVPLPDSPEIFQKQLTKILATINSYYGQLRHANTFFLRKSLYQKNFGVLRTYFKPNDSNFLSFKIKGNSAKPTSQKRIVARD